MNSTSLDQLKRSAPAEGTSTSTSSKRHWLILPALLLGFGALCLVLFGDRLLPRVDVTTAPALIRELSSGQTSTALTESVAVSQASGWIEPDPYPIRVPVKVDGIVETVEVLAGQPVSKGQVICRLDPVDFEFRVQTLQARTDSAKSAVQQQARSMERAHAEHRKANAARDAVKARLQEQEDRLKRVLALDEGVLPEDERLMVEREVAVSRAEFQGAEAEVEAHAAHQEVEKAALETAKTHVRSLEAELARAQTDLERTVIRSPMNGIVLKRFASPGGKRMRGMDDHDSATVVSLYDPEKLQVRVDVPLADAAKVNVGMPARVQSSAFPDQTFEGTVTRIVGEADLSRNTLQVKVALTDPDPGMRPEMLCRVEFMSVPNVGSGGGESFRTSETVWIPESALLGDGEVWVVDPVNETASRRMVETGSGSEEGYVPVLKGVRPGERLVVNPPSGLKAGARVNPVEEGTK